MSRVAVQGSSASSLSELAAAAQPGVRWGGLAALAWGAFFLFSLLYPDREFRIAPPLYIEETRVLFGGWALLLAALAVLSLRYEALASRLARVGPWLVALAFLFALWELLTAKTEALPAPFFAPPASLVEVYANDWPRLLDSLRSSLTLLGTGFAVGAVTGFFTGVLIGWSQTAGYWLHPILRFVGPIPSTALLPLSFFLFPTSFSAASFLIALATWFPLTVLTWSGVAGVNKAYYDVARTMGASQLFLITKVSIPAALPHIFVGLFMGLSASFSVLVAAEMIGVKSGFGFYLQWAQGWAAYSNMYGALIIMALLFSGLITLLFKVRDRLLIWQKGVVKW